MQCSDCQKWRHLRSEKDPSALADDAVVWTCKDNDDDRFNRCFVPQEDCDEGKPEEAFVECK